MKRADGFYDVFPKRIHLSKGKRSAGTKIPPDFEVSGMKDLRDPRLLYGKGCLFLLGGILASGLILAESPSWKVALLLAIAVWCFARAYYFAFYVIEHYIDPGYKFAGLTDFLRYLLRRRKGDP